MIVLLNDKNNYYVVASFRYNLASGTSEKIQLGALLGAFQIVRDIVVEKVKK